MLRAPPAKTRDSVYIKMALYDAPNPKSQALKQSPPPNVENRHPPSMKYSRCGVLVYVIILGIFSDQGWGFVIWGGDWIKSVSRL